MKFKGEKYVWQDMKHICGLPLSATAYAVSEDRLFQRKGIFSITDEEILLYRVRDISLKRTIWQRMLGLGTITVVSSDRSMPTLTIENVKNPMQTKELIHSLVEDMKLRRRTQMGGMPLPEDFDDRG